MSDTLPTDLVAVCEFERPSPPATGRLTAFWRRLRRRVADEGNQDTPESDALELRNKTVFAQTLWEALQEQSFAMLDRAYGAWLRGAPEQETGTRCRVRVCLTSPGLPSDLISTWAEARDHRLLSDLAGAFSAPALVLPSLDPLVTRSPEGLAQLRDFARRVDSGSARILLCGTALQWRWLCHAVRFELIAPEVLCLPPYDAPALAQLIRTHAQTGTMRALSSGRDIIATKRGALRDGYLSHLAATSMGCPWTAMDVLDRSVTQPPEDESGDESGDESAIWIKAPGLPDPFGGNDRSALFVLHALLLHGRLSPEALSAQLPMEPPAGLVTALQRRRLVTRDASGIRLNPGHIAQIIQLLRDAGFPTGEV